MAGFVCSCVQVALYFWFRNPPNDPQNNDGVPPPPAPQNGGELPGAQGEAVELGAVAAV